MDKEKLEKATNENVKAYPHQHRFYTFKQGAEWLQSQPLAEKLSEDDKKSLRELYACYKQHEAVCKEKKTL